MELAKHIETRASVGRKSALRTEQEEDEEEDEDDDEPPKQATSVATLESVWTEADFLPTGWLKQDGTFMDPDQRMFWSVNEVE
jgi:hypothetical protein